MLHHIIYIYTCTKDNWVRSTSVFTQSCYMTWVDIKVGLFLIIPHIWSELRWWWEVREQELPDPGPGLVCCSWWWWLSCYVRPPLISSSQTQTGLGWSQSHSGPSPGQAEQLATSQHFSSSTVSFSSLDLHFYSIFQDKMLITLENE